MEPTEQSTEPMQKTEPTESMQKTESTQQTQQTQQSTEQAEQTEQSAHPADSTLITNAMEADKGSQADKGNETDKGSQADKGNEADKGSEAGKPPVPEVYDLDMPEGFVLDTEALDIFSPVMKELGCTNAQAQKLTDAYIKQLSAQRNADMKLMADNVKNWEDSLKKDTDIGGAKFNENLSFAANVITKYGDNDIKQFLDDTGLGSYPPFVKMMIKIGKAVSEDDWIEGNTGTKSYLSLNDEERARTLLPKSSAM